MSDVKIGIAGIGAVGAAVARALDRGEVPGCRLAAISARNAERGIEFNRGLSRAVANISFAELSQESDIVLEGLPPAMFDSVAIPTLMAGKTLMAMSASQLLGRDDLINVAQKAGGRIVIPSGAILGIDAIKAAAIGTILEVRIVTRKPPSSLVRAKYVVQHGIDLTDLQVETCILKGSVNAVAVEFPANVNVAAALSLAGVGPEQTLMEIWADPNLLFNTHSVSVRSDSSDFFMTIQNRPSDENPATGRITSQSVIAYLRQWNAVLRVGT